MKTDLKKYYSDVTDIKLIEILESPSSYNNEVIDYCKIELQKRNIDNTDIKNLAKNINEKNFYQYFSKGDYLIDKQICLDSFFLSEDEMKKCFENSKYEYTQYINGATQNLPSG